MTVKFCDHFWYDPGVPTSRVFERRPDIYGDSRGSFTEVLKRADGLVRADEWYSGLSWIKQVNRSRSKPGVARGMHAQAGKSCQGKLVQAVYGRIFDVITDARPDSETFGTSDVFELDSATQNQLWVPRGFLHGFVVPKSSSEAVFEYFCDNVYDKPSEICVAPAGLMRKVLGAKAEFNPAFEVDMAGLELSEKDSSGLDYEKWMTEKQRKFAEEGLLWYR